MQGLLIELSKISDYYLVIANCILLLPLRILMQLPLLRLLLQDPYPPSSAYIIKGSNLDWNIFAAGALHNITRPTTPIYIGHGNI